MTRVLPNGSAAVLVAWRSANYRGVGTLERRAERRGLVQAVLHELSAQQELPGASALLITADEVAREQWERHLVASEGPVASPRCWNVRTADELLLSGESLGSVQVVVADELEGFLDDRLGSLLSNHRGAFLGLCATPRGLGDRALRFRRFIGPTLRPTPSYGSHPPDLHGMVADLPRARAIVGAPDPTDDSELPETLARISDPQDLLGFYLSQAQKIPLLSASEETRLAQQIEAGILAEEALHTGARWVSLHHGADLEHLVELGRHAMDRFILSNLRLVYSVGRRYSRRMDVLDIIQEGNLGLIRAVQKFDHRKGYKFSTYATWWIRQAVTRAIADQALMIRLPVHVHEHDAPILAAERAASELGAARAVDIAKKLGIASAEVETILRRNRAPLSLEALASEGFDIQDDVPETDPYERLDTWADEVEAGRLLDVVWGRDRDVLRYRFGFHDGRQWTLDEIGKVFGVTRERIRQVEMLAMLRLKSAAGVPLSEEDEKKVKRKRRG